jgi:hypothetical protein
MRGCSGSLPLHECIDERRIFGVRVRLDCPLSAKSGHRATYSITSSAM